jgi:hypothetical protein
VSRGPITYAAKDPDSTYPAIEQVRPPGGAPDVRLILLGDVGIRASSAFGRLCRTPNADKAFNGRVPGVQLAIDAAVAEGHKASPEDAVRIAMACR